MKKALIIKNLSFFYEEKCIFNNLNLDIERGKWTTIIGKNNSGKSTLCQLMAGLHTFQGKITIDEKDFVKLNFVSENVKEELDFYIQKYNLKNDEKTLLFEIFGIDSILDFKLRELNDEEKNSVAMLISLIKKPKVLLMDSVLENFDLKKKEKIIRLLKEYKMTIITFTHNIEEALYGDDVILIDDGKIVLKGPKEMVLTNESELKKCELTLPFIVDLSIKLKYYDMIDETYFDMGKLIDRIWQ